MSLRFRPHHFLCALCFQGRGYSPAFVANFQNIMQTLNSNQGENASIEVIDHTDSICNPCPNRTHKTCTSEEKIQTLDQSHTAALDFQPGDVITWEHAKKRIAERLTLETFHRICSPCRWKDLGICENVLTRFLLPASGSERHK
ncbi:hypothetical protein AQUSIP_26290 [Aquicella siphonis]|uniref:DUF1284 domain-containing protein n=1 Tax=Aquicella siphonis TaxID=254247 RepID=A0A5E4PM33_9COXI|nr:DUF1284 domain-containing protein [Aquicella siphonis]VVC77302.1 hypothetical protein AQUSIP_26290 [Aquicella siphonis]